MRVFLDPGHGGSNPGCAYGALSEKAYTLEIAYAAQRAFETAGHSAFKSRTKDVTTSFVQRATMAKCVNADLALVLHVNANPDPNVRGLRVYVMPEEPCFVPESLHLAQAVLAASLRHAPPLAHAGRVPEIASLDGQGDDVVLRHYECPAVLVEMGFASNPDDLAYLLSDEGKNTIATTLVAAATAWERARE